ncbi:glutamine amidotransferase [bacterium BMS3Abin08]|nr:glutamine amidotransferase [bacterium BMS3Abin08]
MVLIIKNIAAEGPGTIEDFLKQRNIRYRIVEFAEGEAFEDLGEFSHLVVMGGPMAVYEMDRYAYLKDEAELIADYIENKKRVLGVCLGAQMVAHVLGARVYPGEENETGWYKVKITPEGMADPAMKGLGINNTSEAEVFQWHGDTFDLPGGSVRLASSDAYENQAFRYGSGVYAFQFHIEVTPRIIRGWFEDENEYDVEEMVSHTEKIFEGYLKRAVAFYEGFFS